jgi:hypothetical protein
MRRLAALTVATSIVVLSGCYHAVIDTGRPAVGEAHETPWAHGFIYGLIPPAVTETAKACPGGVAKVETQQSFLNGLASAITFGLYTPMTISYSCAKGGASLPNAKTINVGEAGAQAAMEQAVELARLSNAPVLVHF